MIAPHSEPRGSDHAAVVVRGNTVSALITAALFLYFGFDQLAEPTGSGLFAWCNWVFFHAIRFGGIGFAMVAILSMAGLRIALIVDGLLSLVTGLVFVPCAIGMLIGGGDAINVIVIGVLGGFMIMSGIRDVENWRNLATRTTGMPRRTFVNPDADTVTTVPRGSAFGSDAESGTSIATIRMDDTRPQSKHGVKPRFDDDPNEGTRSVPFPAEKPGAAPPSSGYLAALGKQPPPPPT